MRDTCEYRYTEREEGIGETTPSEDVADALQHRERLAGFVILSLALIDVSGTMN